VDFELPAAARSGPPSVRRRWWLAAFALLAIAAVIGPFLWHAMEQRPAPRVIILGFDGLDPRLVEQYAAAGDLPHFAQFIREGNFHRLATSNPAQSPVSWSSFISGANPGVHGVFDFLARDPQNYLPDLALFSESREAITGATTVATLRRGPQFWNMLAERGIPVTVLHLPMTFPPDGGDVMLAGMGVPDVRGTQGTFAFYGEESAGKATGGAIFQITFTGTTAAARVAGPNGGSDQVTLPMTITRTNEAVTLTLGDTTLTLARGQWSGWVKLAFPLSALSTVHAQGRFHLASVKPLALYLTPLQFDPQHPLFPISVPASYAAELEDELGPYHTLGMPEETWAVNEGRLDDDACRRQYDDIFSENEKLLDRELARQSSGLLLWVTTVTDRAQHMFWRASDPRHPLFTRELAAAHGDAIRHFYQRADAVVGRVRAGLRPDDILLVMSDHGFDSFRRAVHVNTFLHQRGFLAFRDGADTSAEFFEQVDWSKTTAYAVGLNSIFLNRRGREGQGIVTNEQAAGLKQALITALASWRDGEARVIATAYDAAQVYHGDCVADAPDLLLGYAPGWRASWQTALGAAPAVLIEDNLKKWSGDHCFDPALVPGCIASTRPFRRSDPAITDIAATLLRFYGGDTTTTGGQPLW